MSPGTAAGMTEALPATGSPFGPLRPGEPAPRWGALFARLGAAPDDGPHREGAPRDDAAGGAKRVGEYVTCIELIYEGYLLHYRESRVVEIPPGDLESRLLAGDCFYARGLRGIAALGDAAGVGLLARLMATCSFLRSAGAPFAADDALWAYTTGGLAAQLQGARPEAVAAPFDEIDTLIRAGGVPDVPAVITRAARSLPLIGPEPLLAELGDASVTRTGPWPAAGAGR